MELTEIIYSTLVITSFLFVIVVITSFILSKARRPVSLKKAVETIPIQAQNQNRQTRLMREEQKNVSINRSINSSIHQSYQKQDEINILRVSNPQKPKLTIGHIEERNSNGKGLRYSIVNEKVKNLNSRAANFYL